MGNMTLIMDSNENRAWYSPDSDDTPYKIFHLREVRNALAKSGPVLGMLPPTVRWISNWLDFGPTSEQRAYVLLERPPHLRTVLVQAWDASFYGEKHVAVQIPVPWQHYLGIVHLDRDGKKTYGRQGWYMYYSQTQLQDEDHQFYAPCLSNVVNALGPSSNSMPSLCFGDSLVNVSFYKNGEDAFFFDPLVNTFDAYAKEGLSTFWSSPFNRDVTGWIHSKWKEYLYNTYRDQLDPACQYYTGKLDEEKVGLIDGFNTQLYYQLLGQVPLDELLNMDWDDYFYKMGTFGTLVEYLNQHDKSQVVSIADLFLHVNEKFG